MCSQRQGLRIELLFCSFLSLILLSPTYKSFAQVSVPAQQQKVKNDQPMPLAQVNEQNLKTQNKSISSPSLSKKNTKDHKLTITTDLALDSTTPSFLRKTTAGLLALSSGVFVAGGGHLLLDESAIAKQLFWWKLGGLVGIFTGGAILARSGASNLVTPWATPFLIASGASFILPNLLDFAGVWLSSTRKDTQQTSIDPSLKLAPLMELYGRKNLVLSVGTRETVHQAPLPFYELIWSHSLSGFAYQLGSSWSNQQARFRLNVQHPLSKGFGWRLWQGLGLSTHHLRQSQVNLYQGELTLRLALRFGQLIHPKFQNFSGEIFTGWSGGAFVYANEAFDQISGILGGFSMTHHSFNDHVRFKLNYNHRHDDWVGGAIVPGLGSGVLGYIQSRFSVKFTSDFWLATQASFGSAHLYTLHLIWIS